jgi:peptidyl-prolyl cis-trans isomerase SurA
MNDLKTATAAQTLRRYSLFGLMALSSLSFYAAPALAQSNVAHVNGEPITSRQVEQRQKVSGSLFRKPLSRDAAIQEMIEDRVKIAEGKRLGMRVTPAALEEMMQRFASNNRQSPAQFEQNLIRAGIDPDAVRDKLTGEVIWTELLRIRSRNNNVSNAELNAELDRRVAKGESKVTDYVVQQVVFVVPTGVNPGQRERDANAARGRFTDCESGVEYMRTLRDVAVKERIGRTSSDLSKGTADLLGKTPTGRLTAPFRTEQGIEMLAVCEKNEREDKLILRNKIEQEMQSKSTTGSSVQYLNELKSKVVIAR